MSWRVPYLRSKQSEALATGPCLKYGGIQKSLVFAKIAIATYHPEAKFRPVPPEVQHAWTGSSINFEQRKPSCNVTKRGERELPSIPGCIILDDEGRGTA